VSDAEREQVAARIRDAAEPGMLTLAEADERQAAAYAAKVRADLAGLTDDLPAPATERSGEPNLSLLLQPMVQRRLAVHAALAVVLATALIVRWALGPRAVVLAGRTDVLARGQPGAALPLGPPPPGPQRARSPHAGDAVTAGLVAGGQVRTVTVPQLSGRPRKFVRATHIGFSAGWLGLVVAMLTLGMTAATAADPPLTEWSLAEVAQRCYAVD
jgi:hypothetical protein